MKKGFTLIELLIVIAIIGILASIVIVSLGGTTGDAQQKKSQYNVAQAARGLTVKKAQDPAYTYSCGDVGVTAAGTANTNVGVLGCNVSGTKFIVYEKFGTAAGDYFCADSANQTPEQKTVTDAAVGTNVACP